MRRPSSNRELRRSWSMVERSCVRTSRITGHEVGASLEAFLQAQRSQPLRQHEPLGAVVDEVVLHLDDVVQLVGGEAGDEGREQRDRGEAACELLREGHVLIQLSGRRAA
jgi:hypothetical protein